MILPEHIILDKLEETLGYRPNQGEAVECIEHIQCAVIDKLMSMVSEGDWVEASTKVYGGRLR
jgi:hypothetical protein